jgi:tetratricopeptide (TPR) repeat protein/uncharacterized Zn finger protein (UPF0148 family)
MNQLIKCPKCGGVNTLLKKNGQIYCGDCDESFDYDNSNVIDPIAYQEQEFSKRAQALADNNDVWVDMAQWPGPIAYSYNLLRNKLRNGQIDASALILKDITELLARFFALVMLRDMSEHKNHADINADDQDKQKEMIDGLFTKPHSMGSWRTLADDLARQIQKKPEIYKFPEIATVFRDSKGKATKLNVFIGTLTAWRNKESIGHGVRGDDLTKIMDDLGKFLGSGEGTLHKALSPHAHLWDGIVLCDAVNKQITGKDSIQPEHNNSAGHQAYQFNTLFLKERKDLAGRSLELNPYIALHRCQTCDQQEIFHYDSVPKLKVIPDFRMLNYERGHPYLSSGVNNDSMMKEYKVVECKNDVHNTEGFEQDVISEAVAVMLEEASVEDNYVPPTYLQDDLEKWAQCLVENKPHKGVYWLRAPAHVGKSTFIRGLDPTYREKFAEHTVLNDWAVVVFYIRREYQYELAQFADQLAQKLRGVFHIRAQKTTLPLLDIEATDTRKAFCTFLGSFQSLGKKRLLVVIDGLDELDETHPSIADFIPLQEELPPNVGLLLTSRPEVELPDWLREYTPILNKADKRDIELDNVGYVTLMTEFAKKTLSRKPSGEKLLKELETDNKLDDELSKLREMSDGRFLYFSFLINRLAEGDFDLSEINKFSTPEKLIPNYLNALLKRYDGTPRADLIKRVLFYLAVTEDAFDNHNKVLPFLAQSGWKGVPLDVLCLFVEGQSSMTQRLVSVLYQIKPMLGSWRAGNSIAKYKLGIKGSNEIVRDILGSEFAEMQKHMVKYLLQRWRLDQKSEQMSAEINWGLTYLDGYANYFLELLPKLSKEDQLDHLQNLADMAIALMNLGKENVRQSCVVDAVSYLHVASFILDRLKQFRTMGIDIDIEDTHANVFHEYGMALDQLGDKKGAIEKYNSAIGILEHVLSEQNIVGDARDNLLNMLINVRCDLGKSLRDYGRADAASDAFRAALDDSKQLRIKLKQKFTQSMVENSALALRGVGALLSDLDDNNGAAKAFLRATATLRHFQRKHPNEFPPRMVDGLAKGYLNFATTLTGAKAIKYYNQGIEIMAELQNKEPVQFTLDMRDTLAILYINRGRELDNPNEKLESYEVGVSVLLEKRDQLLPDMVDTLARGYKNYALQVKTRDVKQALNSNDKIQYFCKEAIDTLDILYDKLKDNFTTKITKQVADAYTRLGQFFSVACKDNDNAERAYKQAISVWEYAQSQLGEEFTVNMMNSLAESYARIGGVKDYSKAAEIWGEVREKMGIDFPKEWNDILTTVEQLILL